MFAFAPLSEHSGFLRTLEGALPTETPLSGVRRSPMRQRKVMRFMARIMSGRSRFVLLTALGTKLPSQI